MKQVTAQQKAVQASQQASETLSKLSCQPPYFSNLSKSTISWIQKESFHWYNLNVDVINVEVRRSDFAKVSVYSASVPDGIRGDILSPVMDVPDMA